jgi:hypothetical protein
VWRLAELPLPDPIFVDEARANLDVLDQLQSILPATGLANDRVHALFRCARSVKRGCRLWSG